MRKAKLWENQQRSRTDSVTAQLSLFSEWQPRIVCVKTTAENSVPPSPSLVRAHISLRSKYILHLMYFYNPLVSSTLPCDCRVLHHVSSPPSSFMKKKSLILKGTHNMAGLAVVVVVLFCNLIWGKK